jgi:hypothetical protein
LLNYPESPDLRSGYGFIFSNSFAA